MIAIVKVLLVSAWPFLAFYAHNLGRFVSLTTLSACFAAVLATGLIILLGGRLLGGAEALRRTSDVVCVAMLVTFQYSALHTLLAALGRLPLDRHLPIVVWTMLFIGACAWAWRASRRPMVSDVVLAAGIGLVALPLAQIVPYQMSQTASADVLHGPVDITAATNDIVRKPNIYYVVLDGYPRSDNLQKFFGYDNSAFLDGLRQRGFIVTTSSNANYPVTYLSISTTLAMTYVVQPELRALTDRGPFERMLQGENAFVDFVKRAGYTYVHFQNNIWAGSQCSVRADACLNDNNRYRLDETTNNVLSLTPLTGIVRRAFAALNRSADQVGSPPPSGVGSLTAWKRHTTGQPSAPYFLFAHVIEPHPPFFFESDCTYRTTPIGDMTFQDRALYVDQIRCVSAAATELVSEIVKHDADPIIIIASDHGTDSREQSRRPLHEWDHDDLVERFGTLNAIRLPEACRSALYPSLSPVNTLRAVVGCLKGASPRFLPDRSFLASYEDRPDYGQIIEATAAVQ